MDIMNNECVFVLLVYPTHLLFNGGERDFFFKYLKIKYFLLKYPADFFFFFKQNQKTSFMGYD